MLWEGSVTRPDRTFLGSFVPILTKKNRNTIIRKDVRNVKITRSGSIILTSFLIAASIVLFAAAGIILDKPATQMQLEQQTAQAQSSTDIVVGTTAETPIVSQQTAEVVRTVEDLGGSSLNSITFNPRWRQCFTLSHDNNGIIPGLLQDIPTDSSKEIQQRLIQQNKVAMLFAAGVDEWVCWYYSTNFGIEDIPSYVEMQKDMNVHEETWEKLRFFLDNCIFEPTELNGAYWNDGLKQDNGNYTLVSRKTTFENVSATIIFCGDRKPIEAPRPTTTTTCPPTTTTTCPKPQEPIILKNNCGNIQRPQPPEKAPILPPTTTTTIPNPKPKAPENSKPETTFHHPQNPATQPVQDNKSELVKPTPGYIPGTAEKQADSPQGKNTTNPNLDSGTGTAPPGVDLSTGQQGGNAGVSSPTENPKATIETKPAPPPPAP